MFRSSFKPKLDLFSGTEWTDFYAVPFCSTTPTFFVKEKLLNKFYLLFERAWPKMLNCNPGGGHLNVT